jgi:hypothetical protein
MTQSNVTKRAFVLPLLLYAITALSRLPFTSRMLYHMDSVQYALALDHYDIGLHQPHPPGYFVYILMGRVMHWIIDDVNSALIALSVIFTSGTVVVVYLLAKEMFDDRTALLAAVFAITSPNLWFHGAVAMNYGLESFFSVAIAYACWKIHVHHNERTLFFLAILMALSGGVRQNTPIFLIPLVIYACRNVPKPSLLRATLTFVAASSVWFAAMIIATGGWFAYLDAFRELWRFNTGHNSVFEVGIGRLFFYGRTIRDFIVFGIGGGVAVWIFTLYVMVRQNQLVNICKDKLLFFAVWIAPPFLFYLLIFIHPANPGYVLVFTPPLFILLAKSVCFLHLELSVRLHRQWDLIVTILLVGINLYIFLLSTLPVSSFIIRKHDDDLDAMINYVQKFDPKSTAFFVNSSVFYGYRQVMFYLPGYLVFNVDCGTKDGQMREFLGGINKKTFRSKTIEIPTRIHEFALLPIMDYSKIRYDNAGVRFDALTSGRYVASGNILNVLRICPELPLHFMQDKQWTPG